MQEIEFKHNVILGTEDKVKIELTRGQKGTYGWTITAHGAMADPTLAEIGYIDGKLLNWYGPKPEEPGKAE